MIVASVVDFAGIFIVSVLGPAIKPLTLPSSVH